MFWYPLLVFCSLFLSLTFLGPDTFSENLRIEFAQAPACIVKKALLIPEEADGLVKVTDGSHVYIVDSQRVAWIEIG